MSHRDALARGAVMAAMRLRLRHRRAPHQPVCPVDLAIREGLDVRLDPLKSVEGIYTPDSRTIILGTLRPRGRRSYTCAHELGHHVFGHGLRVDELFESDDAPAMKDDSEYVADRFAAALLMPKLAVLHAFNARRWSIATCTPEQVFTIAGVLGVGYTTLVGYLEGTLHAIARTTAVSLRKVSPKVIRRRILGSDAAAGLVVVDESWSGRPVDAEVGDLLLVPPGASTDGVVVQRAGDQLFQATAPGATRLHRAGWQVDIRVMRAGYTGLAEYRYLEESDDA